MTTNSLLKQLKVIQNREILLKKLESINCSDRDLSKLSNDELDNLYKDLTTSFFIDNESDRNINNKRKVADALAFLCIKSIDSNGKSLYIDDRKKRKEKPYFRINERWS